MIRGVLGSRASIGGVLGSGRGGAAAAAWYLAGGVSAANCVAAYQPIGAASLAASYTNLANPGTYTAAPGTAPTFDTATGWTFADSHYLLTGVISERTWSMLCRFSDVGGYVVNKNILIGSQRTGVNDRFYLWPYGEPTNNVYGNGTSNARAGTIGSGVLGVAGGQAYKNGSADGASWSAGTTTSTYQLAIGGHNLNGTVSFFLTGKIQAIAIYNVTLSAATIAAISTAMAAL